MHTMPSYARRMMQLGAMGYVTKNSSKEAQGLRELFEDSLKDIYWAEKALVKALPKMVKKATSEELVAALEDHLAVTKEQVTRLEEVFDLLFAQVNISLPITLLPFPPINLSSPVSFDKTKLMSKR